MRQKIKHIPTFTLQFILSLLSIVMFIFFAIFKHNDPKDATIYILTQSIIIISANCCSVITTIFYVKNDDKNHVATKMTCLITTLAIYFTFYICCYMFSENYNDYQTLWIIFSIVAIIVLMLLILLIFNDFVIVEQKIKKDEKILKQLEKLHKTNHGTVGKDKYKL